MRTHLISPPELEPDERSTHEWPDADPDTADGFIVFSLGASFDESPLDAA